MCARRSRGKCHASWEAIRTEPLDESGGERLRLVQPRNDRVGVRLREREILLQLKHILGGRREQRVVIEGDGRRPLQQSANAVQTVSFSEKSRCPQQYHIPYRVGVACIYCRSSRGG
jgi:hypothetical protein